jgi:lipoyl-dependent peroxiredoxin
MPMPQQQHEPGARSNSTAAQTPSSYTATVAMAIQQALDVPGRVISDDGALALVLRTPAAPGGRGAGTNPEQLLAAGLAASFHAALAMAAESKAIRLQGRIGIVTHVHLTPDPLENGLRLSAELEVALPPMAPEDARTLMLEAERTCPYAKMARSGIRSSFVLHRPAAGQSVSHISPMRIDS